MRGWRAVASVIVLTVILIAVYFSVSAWSGPVEARLIVGSPAPTPTVLSSGGPAATPTPQAIGAAHTPTHPTSSPYVPVTNTPQSYAVGVSLPITMTQSAECAVSVAGQCAYARMLRSGRLAYLDSECGLNVLDLDSGRHWQVSLEVQSAPQLRLSDSGCRIRGGRDRTDAVSVWVRAPDAAGTTLVFDPASQVIEQHPAVAPTSVPASDPSDPQPVTWADDGRRAWFDVQGMQWRLRVASASGEVMLDQPFANDDRLHAMLAWVPGTDILLVQSTYASSGAMLYGGMLSTVDATTGVTRELGLRTRWGESEQSMNPLQPATIDLIVTGTDQQKSQSQRLAEVDLRTGRIEYLTESSARTPLWSPDGTLLAYALDTADQIGHPRSAIVVRDRFGASAPGEPQVLATGDAALGWTADGAALIYARYTSADRRSVELRSVSADGGADALIAANVYAPPCWPECFWPWVVAYQP